MECWLPPESYRSDVFRHRTRPRRAWDHSNPLRPWRFRIRGAYLPRGVIREGEAMQIRIDLANEGRQEGTVYILARLSNAYPPHLSAYCSDDHPSRNARFACIPARDHHCLEFQIPWGELARCLPKNDERQTLAVELEIAPPRRGRQPAETGPDLTLLAWSFHRVELTHNPIVAQEKPKARAFISYAWQGHDGLSEYAHRSWAYRFADALSLAGIRAIIDYNFLSPAMITNETIRREIEAADRVILVYSDQYLARMHDPNTGVGTEYALLRSNAALWAKTIAIRRGVRDREDALYEQDKRFVFNFESAVLEARVLELANLIAQF